MPNAYILNQTPTNYGQAVSLLVEMLVGAGWTYKASGDGLAGYSATGKVFTNTGAGALGWNNNRAWARVADPGGVGGGREFTIQRDASNGIRFKYSAVSKFTGGTPSATVTPSAVDERTLWGSGTDATPSPIGYFDTGTLSGLVRFQGAAMAAAPYGFWMASAVTPGGTLRTGLMLDPVSNVVEDPDPVVWHIGFTEAFGVALGSSGAMSLASFPAPGSQNQGSYGCMNAAGTLFLSVHASAYTVGFCGGPSQGTTWVWTYSFGGLNLNPFNGKHDTLPIIYGRAAFTNLTNLGLKGWSTMMRWQTVQRTMFSDTLNNRQWIAVGWVWLPWDGITQPIN